MAGSPAPVVLPIPGKRNVLVTSALPYSNNIPHLGNVIGSVLSADVYARYCKARGYQTLYVCGTDQYGTATETKALARGITPEELCAEFHHRHEEIYEWFDIKFDIFDKTPTTNQTAIVQDVFTKLWKNGFIEERETIQPFCTHEKHNTFLADRFIEGECSICHAMDARGDQCDACGSMLDPLKPEQVGSTDDETRDEARATGWLINPYCSVDKTKPEARPTKHLFLRLDELEEKIKTWYASSSENGGWSANALAITQAWIDKGLKARAISRDLKWGVPVPSVEGLSDDDYRAKVFYVWFDACIGYVSITKTYTDRDDPSGTKWEQWWKNPENVTLVQFQGKDNVGFHSIVFPASQLGTGEKWTQVSRISATEYLNYEGGKFSKSKNIGVFGEGAEETKKEADIFRFYLLARRPEGADTEFKWEEFADINNNELLKNLGNFAQRTLKFCVAKMDGVVPGSDYSDTIIETHKKQTNEVLSNYIEHIEATKLRAGVQDILSISSLGNKFLQESKLDNNLFADEPERCKAVISVAINHVHLLANIIRPYMPKISDKLFAQLGLESATLIPDTWDFAAVRPGHAIGTPDALFSRIMPKDVAEWQEKFGGDELKKAKEAAKAKNLANKASKAAKKAKKAEEGGALPKNEKAKAEKGETKAKLAKSEAGDDKGEKGLAADMADLALANEKKVGAEQGETKSEVAKADAGDEK